jgi:hypothetical protein
MKACWKKKDYLRAMSVLQSSVEGTSEGEKAQDSEEVLPPPWTALTVIFLL